MVVGAFFCDENKEKDVNERVMLNISKNEKDYLLAHGCYWHVHIFASTTRRHYYAREDQRIINLLDKKRRQEVVR